MNESAIVLGKVGISVGGWGVLQKTCDLAFFRLPQNFLLMPMMRYQKILLGGESGDIYGQLLLVTFFVSGNFGISTV